MPVPEAKESSSSTRPGLFVLLVFFWTVLAQFARVSSSTLQVLVHIYRKNSNRNVLSKILRRFEQMLRRDFIEFQM